MWLLIATMRLIFHINHYLLTHKIQRFVKRFQMFHQPILNYQNRKMVQLEWFLRKRLGPLLKTGLPLMKNVLKPLAKSVLIPLGLTAAGSETHATIRKKIVGSTITTIIISNEEMFDIMK